MKEIKSKLTVESYGISDIGLVRSNNEDAWAELPSAAFYLLADGMGGHKAGEVASREAINHLLQLGEEFLEQLSSKFPHEKVALWLRQAIINTNAYVNGLAKQKEELSDMGTTLCCMIVCDQTLVYGHVGDSRIYRFRDKLECLTEDHSLRQELMSKGFLNEEMASHFPFKNIITRTIGTMAIVEPSIASTGMKSQDIYFLCSDGLTDCVSDAEIERIIKKNNSIKETVENLIKAAKQGGGSDNITVVMIKIVYE